MFIGLLAEPYYQNTLWCTAYAINTMEELIKKVLCAKASAVIKKMTYIKSSHSNAFCSKTVPGIYWVCCFTCLNLYRWKKKKWGRDERQAVYHDVSIFQISDTTCSERCSPEGSVRAQACSQPGNAEGGQSDRKEDNHQVECLSIFPPLQPRNSKKGARNMSVKHRCHQPKMIKADGSFFIQSPKQSTLPLSP